MTLNELRAWAADNFVATTHQTMGQYRTALLRAIDQVIAAASLPAGDGLPMANQIAEQNRLEVSEDWKAGWNACRDRAILAATRQPAAASAPDGLTAENLSAALWDEFCNIPQGAEYSENIHVYLSERQLAGCVERVLESAAPRQPGEMVAGVPKPKKDFLNGWRETIEQLPVSRDETTSAQQDDTVTFPSNRELYEREKHLWPSAQQDEREAVSDTKRLEWVSKNWGGQRPDYAMHVIDRGGDGDLSDIRTFIDKQL